MALSNTAASVDPLPSALIAPWVPLPLRTIQSKEHPIQAKVLVGGVYAALYSGSRVEVYSLETATRIYTLNFEYNKQSVSIAFANVSELWLFFSIFQLRILLFGLIQGIGPNSPRQWITMFSMHFFCWLGSIFWPILTVFFYLQLPVQFLVDAPRANEGSVIIVGLLKGDKRSSIRVIDLESAATVTSFDLPFIVTVACPLWGKVRSANSQEH
jgi:hypothetical protein